MSVTFEISSYVLIREVDKNISHNSSSLDIDLSFSLRRILSSLANFVEKYSISNYVFDL